VRVLLEVDCPKAAAALGAWRTSYRIGEELVIPADALVVVCRCDNSIWFWPIILDSRRLQ
jgi:hypothetical protein